MQGVSSPGKVSKIGTARLTLVLYTPTSQREIYLQAMYEIRYPSQSTCVCLSLRFFFSVSFPSCVQYILAHTASHGQFGHLSCGHLA